MIDSPALINMKKIALVIGHTKDQPGAFSQKLQKFEYEYNTDLAQHLCQVLSERFNVVIYFRDGQTIDGTYLTVSKFNPDLSLEIHFNADNDYGSFGTEMLCVDRNSSIVLARLLQKRVCDALKRDSRGDRGIQIVSQGDRGWESVKSLTCPNVLMEPFFGSSESDSQLMEDHKLDYCLAVYDAVVEFFS